MVRTGQLHVLTAGGEPESIGRVRTTGGGHPPPVSTSQDLTMGSQFFVAERPARLEGHTFAGRTRSHPRSSENEGCLLRPCTFWAVVAGAREQTS